MDLITLKSVFQSAEQEPEETTNMKEESLGSRPKTIADVTAKIEERPGPKMQDPDSVIVSGRSETNS